MATRTVITTGGGDYTSLAGWEAGRQANLTGLGPEIAECSGTTADTTGVVILGWTTTAADYIEIRATGAARHDGKWNTSAYRLSTSVGNISLTVNEEYVRVAGLQIEQTGTSLRNAVSVGSMSNVSDVRLDGCILRTAGSAFANAERESVVTVSIGTVALRNCLLYPMGVNNQSGVYVSGTPVVAVDNCTILDNGTYGINVVGGTVTARNTYCGGNTTAPYNGTMTRTTCAHDTATVYSGSTASVPFSTATLTAVTSGNPDPHLVSGSALIDAGTDLGSTFTTDIDGATRTGTWDIGADEYAGGGGTFGDGAGASALTFAGSASGSALASVAGSTTFALSPAGTGSALTSAAGSVALALSVLSAGSALADGSAAAALAFSPAAGGSSLADAPGSAAVTLASAATGSALAGAAGSATVTTTTAGTGSALAGGAGASALTFAAAGVGNVTADGDGIGTVSLSVSVAGVGSSLASTVGSGGLAFSAIGAGSAVADGTGTGSATFVVTLAGVGSALSGAAGVATLTLTAAGIGSSSGGSSGGNQIFAWRTAAGTYAIQI